MNHLIILIALIMAFVHVAASAQPREERGPMGKCAKPKAPLYQAANANDPLEIILIADHSRLNSGRMGVPQTTKAVAAVKRAGEQAFDYIPMLLTSRGKSRGQGCPVKPFRMVFLDQKIEFEIETHLMANAITPGSKEYLTEYFKMLNARELAENEKNVAQDNNIFDKLGDDVKVVTHCGAANGFMGAPTAELQDRRLLGEYYLYKIIEELNTPVESARLAMITYLTPQGEALYPGVNNTTSRIAFFREPPKVVAKRCGLLTKPPANSPELMDADSSYQAMAINRFLLNSDYNAGYRNGHNANIFYDQQGAAHPAPYDFDLSQIVYAWDGGPLRDLRPGADDIYQFLRSSYRTRALPLAERLVAKRAAMVGILENSILEAEMKAHMLGWLNSYMDAIQKFTAEPAPVPVP